MNPISQSIFHGHERPHARARQSIAPSFAISILPQAASASFLGFPESYRCNAHARGAVTSPRHTDSAEAGVGLRTLRGPFGGKIYRAKSAATDRTRRWRGREDRRRNLSGVEHYLRTLVRPGYHRRRRTASIRVQRQEGLARQGAVGCEGYCGDETRLPAYLFRHQSVRRGEGQRQGTRRA